MWRALVLLVISCGPNSSPGSCERCSGCCVNEVCRSCDCLTCPNSCVAGKCAASSTDASVTIDSGVRPDAGAGGNSPDAGRPDSGLADAGSDAGTDAGDCARPTLNPPNVVPNGEFECPGLPFRSSGGQGAVNVVPGRSGRALRFTTAPGAFNNEFSSTWRFRADQAGRWCARAFVKSSATTVGLRFFVGPAGSAVGEQFELPGPVPQWTRVPPNVPAVSVMAQRGDEGFVVFIDKAGIPGTTIDVDDLDVWRSQDGSCGER